MNQPPRKGKKKNFDLLNDDKNILVKNLDNNNKSSNSNFINRSNINKKIKENDNGDNDGDSNNYESPALTKQESIESLKIQQKKALEETTRLIYATIDTGNENISTLAKQGEQIERIDKTTDNIENDLKLSDKLIQSMNGIFGLVKSWFIKKPTLPDYSKENNKNSKVNENSSNKEQKKENIKPSLDAKSKVDEKKNDCIDNNSGDKKVLSITDENCNKDDHDDQCNLMLDEILNGVGIMNQQSQLLNKQITSQNSRLVKVGDSVDNAINHTDNAVKNMKKV